MGGSSRRFPRMCARRSICLTTSGPAKLFTRGLATGSLGSASWFPLFWWPQPLGKEISRARELRFQRAWNRRWHQRQLRKSTLLSGDSLRGDFVKFDATFAPPADMILEDLQYRYEGLKPRIALVRSFL